MAKINFTDSEIIISIPYKSSDFEIKQYKKSQILPFIIGFIKRRINRCESNLFSNISNADNISLEGVYWKKGHFNKYVYDCLLEFYNSQNKVITPLILEQTIREVLFNSFLTETEIGEKLCRDIENSKITFEEFEMIITDIMFRSMDRERLNLILDELE